ncbi:response regulator transcription factor [Paenibacillus sp. PAMC21692]|uniref:response regulator transcription factor n=1 Tax=Paenibacillus sp. PAMC21692 TaxID=2762320 RepID=UPI00164D72E4|nr:response regulator transcription factor [Paenibacillus sp. PAMC21692]QNK59952.1 response regulator transcription factor [Paenibacillus sp. PAMC21692]
MIRIVIVDDHAMVRSGLRMLLSSKGEIEVVAEGADGDEGIRAAMEHHPDVVLMDLSMPQGKDGITAASELKKLLPDVAVLMLSMHDDTEYLFRAIEAGASGYVLKSAPHEELLNAIRTVASGAAYLYPSATRQLMNRYAASAKKDDLDAFDTLSEREKEVLSLAAKGYGNKEIAELLFISVKTVESHKSNVMEKLGLKTRPELIQYAMKKGLLQFD